MSRAIKRSTGLALAALVSVLASGTTVSAQDLTRSTRTIEVGGLAFPILDFGEGSPVLLLHGFPDDRYVWRNQVLDFANAGLRVIAPDLRGFGDAPRPQDPTAYDLDTVAKDVIGILDALRVGHVQMVGHGLGAAVGWHIAARYPKRVSRFVALAVGAPATSGGSASASNAAASAVPPAHAAFLAQANAEDEIRRDDWKWLRSYLGAAPDTEKYIEKLSRPGALTAALNWFRPPTSQLAPEPPLAEVSCEVLGIWSDRDAYFTEDQMRTSGERIKGAFEYAKIAGASHWTMLDKARELNRLILAFLQREI